MHLREVEWWLGRMAQMILVLGVSSGSAAATQDPALLVRDINPSVGAFDLAQLPQLAPRNNEFCSERKAKFLKSFDVSLRTRV